MSNRMTSEDLAKYLFGNGAKALKFTDEQQEHLKKEIQKMEDRMRAVGIEVTSEELAKAVSNQTVTLTEPVSIDVAKDASVPIPSINAGGGRVNYYLVQVAHPQREEQAPYQAECEDLIEALGLNFDEGNIFKELWRTANERTHGNGKPGNSTLRASEKVNHYAARILKRAQRENGENK